MKDLPSLDNHFYHLITPLDIRFPPTRLKAAMILGRSKNSLQRGGVANLTDRLRSRPTNQVHVEMTV